MTPFDAVSKRMSIERADGRVYIKGAVETVLPLCVEGTDDVKWRHGLLRKIGYKR